MSIEIVEPDDGSQLVVDGKLLVMCDCSYTDPCPQGKKMGADRCTIRVCVTRLKKKEVLRLCSSQR